MSLKNIITEKIKYKNGIISFAEFMNLALYHHQYGYYRANTTTIGSAGDFTTAPEISALFGKTITKQLIEIYHADYDILEFGAGNGVLAMQILSQLDLEESLPNKYYILELSANLIAVQQQNITKLALHLQKKVVWLKSLPKTFKGIIIANEVLDAIPTKRVISQNYKFYELGVSYINNDFNWQKFDTEFYPAINHKLTDGYVAEINQQADIWLSSIANILTTGAILLIDYGYNDKDFFHPMRKDGTLRCYKNHIATDNPFINIGKQDISSWVNFSNIANTAKNSNLQIAGYATQAMFLISLGIEKLLTTTKDIQQYIKHANEIKQLVLPDAMGDNFKVLLLTKNKTINASGFSEQNLSYTL